MLLGEFFRATTALRQHYGGHDCFLWAADWAVICGHPDPAEPHRGAYSSLREARAVVAGYGDLLSTASAGMARAGLAAADPTEAVSGDIGLGLPNGLAGNDFGTGEPTALIRAGYRWAHLDYRLGVVIGEAEVIAAWRV